MDKKTKGPFGCAHVRTKARGQAVRIDQAQGVKVDKGKGRSVKRGTDKGVLLFGITSVAIPQLKSSEIERNIKAGQAGLDRALEKIIEPGIKLEAVKGVPLFHADPLHPGQIIRELDGKSERGVIVKGKFKIIK
jgi:hypothetical protein